MAFTPLTFSQILSRMLAYFAGQTTGVTDQNIGSVARTLMEASAIEQERAYVQMAEGIAAAIDTSAYQSFNFGLLSATASYGDLTLTRMAGYAPDITIDTKAQFMVSGTTKVYGPTGTTVWTGGAASTTKVVKVQALQTGAATNTPAGTITTIFTPITGVASCTNLKAFVTGTDAETADARRSRFSSYVASLPRATKAAIEYGAKTAQILDNNGFITERVAKARAAEVNTTATSATTANAINTVTPASMSGIVVGSSLQIDTAALLEMVTVIAITGTTFTAYYTKAHGPAAYNIIGGGNGQVYIHNGVGTSGGQATSASLVAATQAVIDGTSAIPGYRAAGIPVTVAAATEVDVPIRVIITNTLDGFTVAGVRSTVITAVNRLVSSLGIGDTLFLSTLVSTVRAVAGVGDCVIVLPTTDTVVAVNQIVVSNTPVLASQFPTTAITLSANIA